MNDSVVQHHIVLTPGMVISWLPRNATPAQQDSAVQSRFKASEIRWSTYSCHNTIVKDSSRRIPCFIRNCREVAMV